MPAGTELYIGRIGAQKNFGLMKESGFQYQLISDIPSSSYVNTRLISQLSLGFNP